MIQTNPIVITGCSYNGMLSALALANKSIESIIIEKKQINNDFFIDPRTTSVTSSSKSFFLELDIWHSFEKYAACVNHIYIVDNKNPTLLEFDYDNFDALGYMIENYHLKRILYKLVSQNKFIKVIQDSSYESVNFDNSGCNIKFHDNSEITTPLLIVCDGRNSALRRQYFPYLINKDYEQLAFVFNVSHEKQHENCAVEHFFPTGPFAILPLVDQHQSAIVWSVKVDLAIVYKSLDSQKFQEMVQDLFGQFLGKITIITKISSFNLSAQIVEKYFFNNIVLVGDSAHCIHPLAGQGLNQGIKDIKVLSGIIKKYYDLGLDINSHALSEYQNLRKFDNLGMFLATDFLDKIFSNRSKSLSLLRKIGFRFLNKFPQLKKQIINYGVGI